MSSSGPGAPIPPPPGNIPPPPPGGPPPVAPPGAPPVAGAKTYRFPLRPEIKAHLEEVEAQAKVLFERIAQGDASARDELAALRKPLAEDFKHAKEETQIENKKNRLQFNQALLQEKTSALKKVQTLFERARQTIDTEIKQAEQQAEQFPNYPLFLARIREALDVTYPQRLHSLTETMNEVVAREGNEIADITQQIETLQSEIKIADAHVYQYYILDSACVPPKKIAAPQATSAKKIPPIDLYQWHQNGIISGFFYTNLYNFLITQSDVDADRVETTYNQDFVLNKYAKFVSNPLIGGFDHESIIAIATGYITRNYNTHPYMASDLMPLENIVIDHTMEDMFQAQLEALYQMDPNFRPETDPTAPSTSSAPAQGGFNDVAERMSSLVEQRGKPFSSERSVSAVSTAPSSSSSSTVTSAPKVRAGIQRLDDRTAAAFQSGNENQRQFSGKKIGAHGVTLTTAQEDAENVASQLTLLVGEATKILEKSMEESVLRMAAVLELDPKKHTPEQVLATAAERLESPDHILKSQWGKTAAQHNTAITNALDRFRQLHPGRTVSSSDLQTLAKQAGLKGNDYNLVIRHKK